MSLSDEVWPVTYGPLAMISPATSRISLRRQRPQDGERGRAVVGGRGFVQQLVAAVFVVGGVDHAVDVVEQDSAMRSGSSSIMSSGQVAAR
jgi:hypothetical protein